MRYRSLDILVIVGLWVTLLFIHRYIVGTHYLYLSNDHNEAMFGLGISWLTFHPRLYWPNPAPTTNMLSGLIVSVMGVDKTPGSLKTFLLLGTVAQGFVVFLAAIWFSWIADILKLTTLNRLVLISLVFCFPPLLGFLGYWGNYFEFGLLGLPTGLTILAALRGYNNTLTMSGIGCGLLVANNYPSIGVFGAFLVALSWQSIKSNGWPTYSSLRIHTDTVKDNSIFILFLAICLIASPIVYVVWNFLSGFHSDGLLATSPIAGLSFVFIVGSALWIMVSYLSLIYFSWNPKAQKVLTSSLLTFVFANFILLPWYPWSLWGSFSKVASPGSIISESLFSLSQEPWLAVFWLLIAAMVFVGIKIIVRPHRKHSSKEIGDGLLFCGLSIFILLLGIGSTIKVSADSPGLGIRQMIAFVPALSAGWVIVLGATNRHTRTFIQGLVIVICLITLGDYFQKQNIMLVNNRLYGEAVDKSIDKFFHEHPDGTLVCGRDPFHSVYCGPAFAYNHYRSKSSARAFPTRYFFNDRVIWASANDSNQEIQRLLSTSTGPVLVISNSPFKERLIRFFSDNNYSCVPTVEFVDLTERRPRLFSFHTTGIYICTLRS